MCSPIKSLLFIATVAVVVGCASVPRIDSPPGALASVKTVAVIRSPEPKTYTVWDMANPLGFLFGPIGSLVAAADRISKQDTLTQAIKEKNKTPTSGILAQSIATQLTHGGFDAKVEEGPWEWKEDNETFSLEFEKIASSADAVLVVTPTIVGFIFRRDDFFRIGDYLPTITVVATLLGKDREVLYRGYHAVGWKPGVEGWRHSPPKVTFSDFDALMADPEKTAAALSGAASEIAITVAEDLKR